MAVLVTGGAGFIGSHTCVELLNAGFEVVVVDNLYNASEESLKRVEEITGKTLKFYKTDILDREGLDKIFKTESIDCVIHFAGYKAVGESVQKPLEYYYNNTYGCNETERLQEHSFFLFGHGLRGSEGDTDNRGVRNRRSHQSLRQNEIHDRADP